MQVGADRTLTALLETFDGAGFVIDEDGVYREVLVGPSGVDLLYRDPEALLGHAVDEVLPPATADRFRDVIDAVLSGGDAAVLEYDLEVGAGREWFEATVTPVETDTDREAVMWLARRITDRKAREHRQAVHQRKIRALLEVAAEMQACTEEQAVYDLLIETAEDVLAFDIAIVDAVEDDVLVPRSISEEVPEGGYFEETPLDPEENVASRVFVEGETDVEEDVHAVAGEAADPSYRSVLTIPIGDFGVFQAAGEAPGLFDEDDRELGELLVSHAQEALTRIDHEQAVRERTSELERQYERLDAFASIVSHDLRNPLAVAQGYMELVSRDCESEDVDHVIDALDRLETIIDGTLALARQGKTIGETEPIELSATARSSWATVSSATATLEVVEDATILADGDRLKQVFENLFRNAVEHGGQDATVEVGVIGGAGFYVEDDGPGIPPDAREAIFEPGYSGDGEDTGFGLAIVREIVEAHGWAIEAGSSDRGGARFEVTGVSFA
ncbi:MAG: PAS domain-containing sensor histidine kinase [Halobacteriales archaeon]